MARKLFDTGIFSVLTSGGSIGVGWLVNFYTGGTTTPITTYNDRTAGSPNSNPVPADANGRFPEIWIADSQTIKWVLTDANGVVKATVDDYLIDGSVPTIAAGLDNFLAGSASLALASGGTGAATAANAAANLAVLPTAGGTMTGNIVRNAKGVHTYFNAAAMTGGQIYIQAAGADPTANPGDVVFEY